MTKIGMMPREQHIIDDEAAFKEPDDTSTQLPRAGKVPDCFS